jgi:purine-binding chemotaxis protein CheW
MANQQSKQLLIGSVGDRIIGVPTESIERIIRMAMFTPVPEAPAGVAGVLDVHGDLVPVIDPRDRLGLSPSSVRIDQCLLMVVASTRFLIWLDGVRRVANYRPDDITALTTAIPGGVTPLIARIDGCTVPVLSIPALDPGPILLAGALPQ